jgi:ribosomal protein L16 Arg81 hydroxylase
MSAIPKLTAVPSDITGATLATLATLFGADGVREFLAGHWPERSFSTRRPLADLPAVLRREELSGLDGLARQYRGPIAFGRGSVDTRTFNSDAYPAHLFKLGFTVYLYDIAASVPGLSAWLSALERDLGVPEGSSKIGAFASPSGDGLPIHFDADDVISVQLSGSKTFDIAPVDSLRFPVGQQFGPGMLPGDELYPQVSAGFPSPAGVSLERIRMEPGSVLYLPRGTWHTTRAESDSFSISIGIRPPAALDYLLPQLRALLLQDARWRRPLYGIAGSPENRSDELTRLDDLLSALPDVSARLSANDLAPPPANSPPDPGRVQRFQRVPMASLTAEPSGNRIRVDVTAWDREWVERTTLQTEVPAHLLPALAWLRDRDSAFASSELKKDLTGVPDIDVWQLLDLLTRAGYLRRLAFPLLHPA